MGESKPWERQPGESSKAWEARRTYIHLGPMRSIEAVSRQSAKSIPLLKRWSVRWRWVATALEFDAYRDKLASIASTDRFLAEAKAKAERWARRDDEQPECSYSVYIDSYNDIVQYMKDVKDGKRKANPKEKAILQRSFALLDPLARTSREEVARLRATSGPPSFSHAGDPQPPAGRTLAVLKAFVDFGEDESEAV